MNQIRQLAGQTLTYGLGTIVPRFINYLILVPFYTRIFTDQAQYGIISELYAYVVVLLVVLTYGMETSFFRFSKKEGDPDLVYSTAMISLLVTSSLFFLLILLLKKPVAGLLLYPDHPEYIVLFSAIVAIDAFTAIPFARLRKQNKALRFSMIKLINVSVIVLSVLFLLAWAPKHPGKVEAILPDHWYSPEVDVVYVFIANLLGSIITLILLLKDALRIPWRFNFRVLRGMLKYGYPLLIAGLAGSLNDALDKMVLKRLLPAESNPLKQLGIYAANYKIAVLMSLFIQMFRFALEPFFFEKSGQRDARKSYADVMKYFLIVSFLLFLGINLYINVVKILIPVHYQEALDVVPVVSMGYLLFGVFVNLSVWYKINDMTRYGAYITLAGVAVTLSMNILLIPRYGYYASAWAHVACYGVMVLLSYFLGKKKYPVPYDLKGIALYGVLGTGLFLLWDWISFPNLALELFVSTVFILIFVAVSIVRDKTHLILKPR